jgi:hypothetical protein
MLTETYLSLCNRGPSLKSHFFKGLLSKKHILIFHPAVEGPAG